MKKTTDLPTFWKKKYSKVIFFGGDGEFSKNNAEHYFDPGLGTY